MRDRGAHCHEREQPSSAVSSIGNMRNILEFLPPLTGVSAVTHSRRLSYYFRSPLAKPFSMERYGTMNSLRHVTRALEIDRYFAPHPRKLHRDSCRERERERRGGEDLPGKGASETRRGCYLPQVRRIINRVNATRRTFARSTLRDGVMVACKFPSTATRFIR